MAQEQGFSFWSLLTFEGNGPAEEEKDQEGTLVQISPLEEGPYWKRGWQGG